MKTLFVSLAALAAVSSAALAAGGDDFRDSDAYFGKYSTQSKAGLCHGQQRPHHQRGSKKKTAFERMDEISEGNEHGGKDNGRDHACAPKV